MCVRFYKLGWKFTEIRIIDNSNCTLRLVPVIEMRLSDSVCKLLYMLALFLFTRYARSRTYRFVECNSLIFARFRRCSTLDKWTQPGPRATEIAPGIEVRVV